MNAGIFMMRIGGITWMLFRSLQKVLTYGARANASHDFHLFLLNMKATETVSFLQPSAHLISFAAF
ncbi:hypothetical protein [Methylomusa anaerophila]|uniref:hypothetical protein n=1 Tax=Methylomusa anaerophila TaxID=1930071 RepID=UPI001E5FE847|nr:hypothetical protein [Methylomusa anaerophila]